MILLFLLSSFVSDFVTMATADVLAFVNTLKIESLGPDMVLIFEQCLKSLTHVYVVIKRVSSRDRAVACGIRPARVQRTSNSRFRKVNTVS